MKRLFCTLISLFIYSFLVAQQAADDSLKSSQVTTRATTEKKDSSKVFTKVEKEASFEGGAIGWRRYLEQNTEVNVAERQGLPKGIYTVVVEFVVNEEGIVTEVKPVAATKACTNCIKEAVRVIKSSPKWTPAFQSGKAVKYKAKQSLKFTVYDY